MRVLITGAAGFIGQRMALACLAKGWDVVGLDSMVKPSAAWPTFPDGRPALRERYQADVRAIDELPMAAADAVIHLAAQTAVTRSYDAPLADFQANAEGTFRVALWARRNGACMIYASTNKVYGALYGQEAPVGQDHPLDPCTPYGVSKATGALYVRELLEERSLVFHQSCIYGPTQVGTVDQGWVAWVAHAIANEIPVTCYGDGQQVRDLLHVDDLCALYVGALDARLHCDPDWIGWGWDYAVGGGRANAYSFAEVVGMLGGTIDAFAPARPKDQRYFVSANEGLPEQWVESLQRFAPALLRPTPSTAAASMP